MALKEDDQLKILISILWIDQILWLTRHVDQNDLKNPDDVTLVIKPNSDILEPEVNVNGIENVKVSVHIPKDRNEAIEETLLKIDVPKASDTEIIDVEQLNSDVKTAQIIHL